jgi:hypothetical protein
MDFDKELERLLVEDRSRHSWAALSLARSAELISRELHHIARDLHAIRGILVPLQHLTQSKVNLMPKTIAVGGTSNAVISATKADGTPFLITAADQVSLAASVNADVTFGAPVFNSDGTATIVVTGVNPDPSDEITATVDGVVSAPDALTISSPAPAAVTVALT